MDLLRGPSSLKPFGQVKKRPKFADCPEQGVRDALAFADVPAKCCPSDDRSLLIAQRDDGNLHGEGPTIPAHPDGFEMAIGLAGAHAIDHVLGGGALRLRDQIQQGRPGDLGSLKT